MAGIRRILGEFVRNPIYWIRNGRFEHHRLPACQSIVFLIAFFQGSTLSLAYAEVREFEACSSKVLIEVSDTPRASHRANSAVRYNNNVTRYIYNYNM